MLLHVASFMDVRFKQHAALDADDLATAKDETQKMALMVHEKYPVIAEHYRLKSLRPDEQTLSTLAKHSPKKGRGRGRGRGRSSASKETASLPSQLANAKGLAKPPRALKQVDSDEAFMYDKKSTPTEEAVEKMDTDLATCIQDEMTRWEAVHQIDDVRYNPLSWWRQNCSRFPLLAPVAQHLLGIPGGTAMIERLFSAAGRAVTRRRPRLSAKRAAATIFGHANVVRGVTGSKKANAESESTSARSLDL